MLITLKPKIEKNNMFRLIEKIIKEQRELRGDLYRLEKMIQEIEFEEVGETEKSPTQE